jgi:hypothetical protein
VSYLVFFAIPTVLIILLTPILLAEPRVRRRFAARNKAEKKAFELLQSWRIPQQEKQWAASCGFEVIGCHTGSGGSLPEPVRAQVEPSIARHKPVMPAKVP